MPQGSPGLPPSERTVILVADRAVLVKQAAKLHPMAKVHAGLGAAIIEFAFEKLYSDKDNNYLIAELEKTLDLRVPLAVYSPSEAQAIFQFDVGHTASNGTLYLLHPLFPNRYIAPSEFSRILAREREAAFRQLAAALGAKKIELIQVTVKTKKGFFGAKVSIPEAAADVGIKASFDKEGSFSRQVYATFGKPHLPPHVPEDLEPWVAMDPDLRTMVRARVDANQLQFRINLEFKQMESIGGEIAAKVAGRGLGIGGSFDKLTHSVWSFEVEFWDRAET